MILQLILKGRQPSLTHLLRPAKRAYSFQRYGKLVHKICLTGGPCAGKTTALSSLSSILTEQGFRVFTVPEAATILMNGGAMGVVSK